MNRKVGIIFHISSIPSKYGIGTFGKKAYEVVDILEKSDIKIWQILPLNQTSYGDSPYQSPSSNGLNIYFIDLDKLIEEKLLTKEEVESIDFGSDPRRVDYAKQFSNRIPLLKKAFSRFKSNKEFEIFLERNLAAQDFSFFMTLKEINDGKPWYDWGVTYSSDLEEQTKSKYSDLYNFYMWTQFEFLNQYNALKTYANAHGVQIMGDIPIYLAYDSVECFKHSELFEFDENKKPINVAGCPPDCFSVDGQLWGNPLYNWEYHEKTNFEWWSNRINKALELYDLVRIDHFRGFSGYYSIPAQDKTAKNGCWRKGPGMKLFKNKLNLPIIAEDLGYIDEDFEQLMKDCKYPGMKIVTQGTLATNLDDTWRPRNYTENFFSYTSTHDSETTMQYLINLDKQQKETLKTVVESECEYFGI